jgi:hypothetical protein
VRATLATLIVALASTVRVTDPGALDTVDTISRLTDAYTRYSGQGLAVQRFALERQAAQR